ncbi:hypothetical protein PAPYR_3678 [Paratrimastix pyriformis]|uniref:F-box domain-containing protein n=1 Tax=Paratrimastix pyriformis TaxID=342808 RepID=A0ABQ8URD8_9EUKA|nr:hypothetical protein PAPYR_3678 [Paratrimastix pyriformis]
MPPKPKIIRRDSKVEGRDLDIPVDALRMVFSRFAVLGDLVRCAGVSQSWRQLAFEMAPLSTFVPKVDAVSFQEQKSAQKWAKLTTRLHWFFGIDEPLSSFEVLSQSLRSLPLASLTLNLSDWDKAAPYLSSCRPEEDVTPRIVGAGEEAPRGGDWRQLYPMPYTFNGYRRRQDNTTAVVGLKRIPPLKCPTLRSLRVSDGCYMDVFDWFETLRGCPHLQVCDCWLNPGPRIERSPAERGRGAKRQDEAALHPPDPAALEEALFPHMRYLTVAAIPVGMAQVEGISEVISAVVFRCPRLVGLTLLHWTAPPPPPPTIRKLFRSRAQEIAAAAQWEAEAAPLVLGRNHRTGAEERYRGYLVTRRGYRYYWAQPSPASISDEPDEEDPIRARPQPDEELAASDQATALALAGCPGAAGGELLYPDLRVVTFLSDRTLSVGSNTFLEYWMPSLAGLAAGAERVSAPQRVYCNMLQALCPPPGCPRGPDLAALRAVDLRGSNEADLGLLRKVNPGNLVLDMPRLRTLRLELRADRQPTSLEATPRLQLATPMLADLTLRGSFTDRALAQLLAGRPAYLQITIPRPVGRHPTAVPIAYDPLIDPAPLCPPGTDGPLERPAPSEALPLPAESPFAGTLRRLAVSECSISALMVDAPGLRSLSLQGCPELRRLFVGSPGRIERLRLEAVALGDAAFEELFPPGAAAPQWVGLRALHALRCDGLVRPRVSGCPALERVGVEGARVAALRLARCPRVEAVRVVCTAGGEAAPGPAMSSLFADLQAEEAAGILPPIRSLALEGLPLSDRDLAGLLTPVAASLLDLSLTRCPALTGPPLPAAAAPPEQSAPTRRSRAKKAAPAAPEATATATATATAAAEATPQTAWLPEMPALFSLAIHRCPGLAHVALGGLGALEHLQLEECPLRWVGLAGPGLPRLRVADIRACDTLQGAAVEALLRGAPELTALSWPMGGPSPDVLELNIDQGQGQGQGPVRLERLAQVDLSGHRITDQAVGRLLAAAPGLLRLVLRQCPKLRRPIGAAHERLEELDLTGNFMVKGVKEIAQLLPRLASLRR